MLRLLGFSSSQETSRCERSGRARDSILMTSAPIAARYLVQIGPAITQLKSTIRTPVERLRRGDLAPRAGAPAGSRPGAGEGS